MPPRRRGLCLRYAHLHPPSPRPSPSGSVHRYGYDAYQPVCVSLALYKCKSSLIHPMHTFCRTQPCPRSFRFQCATAQHPDCTSYQQYGMVEKHAQASAAWGDVRPISVPAPAYKCYTAPMYVSTEACAKYQVPGRARRGGTPCGRSGENQTSRPRRF